MGYARERCLRFDLGRGTSNDLVDRLSLREVEHRFRARSTESLGSYDYALAGPSSLEIDLP